MGGGADKGIPAPGWRGNARPQATHNATHHSRLPPAPPAALPGARTRSRHAQCRCRRCARQLVRRVEPSGSAPARVVRAALRDRVALPHRLAVAQRLPVQGWIGAGTSASTRASAPEPRQSARLPGQAATRSGRETGSLPTGCAAAPCAAAAACGLWRPPVRPPSFESEPLTPLRALAPRAAAGRASALLVGTFVPLPGAPRGAPQRAYLILD